MDSTNSKRLISWIDKNEEDNQSANMDSAKNRSPYPYDPKLKPGKCMICNAHVAHVSAYRETPNGVKMDWFCTKCAHM